MNLDQIFAEALSTSQTATAATARYVDALGARARFATCEEYREHRAAMREAMRVARGIASAALEAYCSATRAANAIALDAYLAERIPVRVVCSNTFTVDATLEALEAVEAAEVVS